MCPLSRFALAATAVAALAAPSAAHAAWTAPVALDPPKDALTTAQGALGGSVLAGDLQSTVSLAKRSGDAFSAFAPIMQADQFEKVWSTGLAGDGSVVVLTVRRHKPTQRIRATVVAPDGVRGATRTISDPSHSASRPVVAVAPDGTAVAAWQWHDPAGWRAQAAIRKPGAARFERPQTISPPVEQKSVRPRLNVAAGVGGRGAVTWQIGGNDQLPEAPLHVRTAGIDGVFGADQALAGAGGLAMVGFAISGSGEVQLAYLDMHFSGHEARTSLRVTQGAAGSPLPAPAVLSRGGKGTSSGTQIAAAFSADGTATVAWAKPGDRYEDGGALEVFTRAPAAASFGPAQTLAQGALGVGLAASKGASAAVAWMTQAPGQDGPTYTVHAATRPQAGGAFSADQPLGSGLWPSIAMTPDGDAIAAWGDHAAIHHAD